MNVPLKQASPTLPEDIRPKWFSVIRACQAAISRSNNSGLAVVSLNVVIDSSGNPVCWMEPTVAKVHPQRSAQEIVALLSRSL